MKNLFTFLALFLSFGLLAQNDVIVKINHKFGTSEFEMGTAVTCYAGYDVKVNRLQYYLNDFRIHHDGGQETIATQHFLINANNATELNLGSFDISQVDSITFSVGVHPDRNHLDPSSYTSTHPLAPQNPSMHWGWTAGYRFIALEGKAGTNTNTLYQIHALGDDNYKTLTVPASGNLNGSTVNISIDADYFGMFKGIDVTTGVITHGEYGESITLMDNFAKEVFFPEGEIPVNIIDPAFEGKFQVQPNPSFNTATTVVLNLPIADNYQLTLTDIMGRVIDTQKVNSGEQSIEISTRHSGVYFIHLWKDGEPVAYKKWMVK